MNAGTTQGMDWIKQGWKLFMTHPNVWPLLSGLWFLTAVLMSFAPKGWILCWLVGPAVYAGFIYAASRSEQGHQPEPRDLLVGFKNNDKRWAFMTLAAMTMLGGLVLSLVMSSITGGGELMSVMQAPSVGTATSSAAPAGLILSILLRLVLTGIVTVLLVSGLIFAAPLIMFGQYDGIEALMTSAEKVWGNWRMLFPVGVLYAVVGSLAMLVLLLPKLTMVPFVLATLLMGVGIFVLAPLAYCASFVSYRELFLEAEEPAPDAAER